MSGIPLVTLTPAAGKPAHNNSCGPFLNKIGHPCLRIHALDVQVEGSDDWPMLMTCTSHFFTRI